MKYDMLYLLSQTAGYFNVGSGKSNVRGWGEGKDCIGGDPGGVDLDWKGYR